MKMKKQKKPKTIEISLKAYCGFAFNLPVDDKRLPKFEKQRLSKGFDTTELWALDQAIAKFILPRLKAFRKSKAGVSCFFETREEQNEVYDKMIKAFQGVLDGRLSAPNDNSIHEGIKLFAEYYFTLWS